MLDVCRVAIIEDFPGEDTIDFRMCLEGDDGVGMGQQHLVAFCELNKTMGSCMDFSNMELRCRLFAHISLLADLKRALIHSYTHKVALVRKIREKFAAFFHQVDFNKPSLGLY
jgi:hypothetical protein